MHPAFKVTDLYKYEISKIMYHHSKQSLPFCFSIFFINITSIHSRQTRAKTNKQSLSP